MSTLQHFAHYTGGKGGRDGVLNQAQVQALTVDPVAKNPRRVVTGLDSNRVPMVLAVLQARAGQRTNDKDAYVATVGGMRITETATDLAVALATWSSLHEQPLPAQAMLLDALGEQAARLLQAEHA